MNVEEQLRRAARDARSMIEASLDPLVTIDVDGIITDVNAATEMVTGLPREELIGSDFPRYFTNPDQARAVYEQVFTTGSVTNYPLEIRHTTGSITPVLYNASVYRDEHGEVVGVFAAARDISGIRIAEQELAEEARFRFAMDSSAIGMMLISAEGEIERVNPAMCDLLGWSADEMLTLTMYEIVHPDDQEADLAVVEEFVDGRTEASRRIERFLTSTGQAIWVELSLAAVRHPDQSLWYFVAQILDVTDRVNAEQALIHLAAHDPLTGLANRLELADEITRALHARQRSGKPTAVLMIDLDRFKNINDTLGHAAGDELLIAVAQRIASTVRAGDLVARPGGDEFIVVMREIDEPTEAVRAASRIVEQLRAPFASQGSEFFVTASIGIAVSTESSAADDLVREADTALYVAKEGGRDRVAVFNEELRVAVAQRLSIESDLRRALERDEFVVWYQPEVDLATGAVIAVEALLRWRHPDGDLYPAARFIEIAEETGLILDIGTWVLNQACVQAADWATERPNRPLTVRLNVSTLQLAETGLLDDLDSAISRSGANPASLCIEITETALLHDTPTVHANLHGIRSRGISIALDDFGTGYASLATLRSYPIDVLKIDRSFITDMIVSEYDLRLVRAIVALADILGLSVTAEGVEHEEQARLLHSLGCPSAQGFLYSAAVPAEAITALLETTFPHP